MSAQLKVTPDPAHPGGGYARLHFPAGAVPGPTVEMSVFGLFREKYLGQTDWQPVPAQFGPYAVQSDPTGGTMTVIGPEIVNAMDEFVSVRFDTGSFQAVASWPDTISPDQNATPIGMISVPGAKPADRTLRGNTPSRHTPAPQVADSGPEDADRMPPVVTDPVPIWRHWWLWAIVVVVLVVAAWALLMRPDPVTDAPPDALAEDAEAPAGDNAQTDPSAVAPASPVTQAVCTAEAVDAAGADLTARLAGAASLMSDGTCNARAASDLALRLIEREAEAQDPEALMLFGQIYDPFVTASPAQDSLGISLSEDPAIAMDYYTRAAEAGATDADAALRALCTRTQDDPDPLIAATREELCP